MKCPKKVRGTYRRLYWWDTRFAEHVSKNAFTPGVLPSPHLMFRSLELTRFEDVRVVIVGNGPSSPDYNGLAYSTHAGSKINPSTCKIFDEYQRDLGFRRPTTGDLTTWAMNGILLLPYHLTLSPRYPSLHKRSDFGWQQFVYEIIRTLSTRKRGLVFHMWGACNAKFHTCVDTDKHMLITTGACVPPIRSHDVSFILPPFHGSRPFSRTCDYLDVDPQELWRLP